MPQVEGETSIPRWMFLTGAAAVVIGVGALVWFAIPDIDTRHRLTSPSGQVALDLGEDCREGTCAPASSSRRRRRVDRRRALAARSR